MQADSADPYLREAHQSFAMQGNTREPQSCMGLALPVPMVVANKDEVNNEAMSGDRDLHVLDRRMTIESACHA